jgi:hypothetical protein
MLGIDALFDWVGASPSADLDHAILTVVGRVTTMGPRTTDFLNMARVSRFLLEELRLIGGGRLVEIEAVAAGML